MHAEKFGAAQGEVAFWDSENIYFGEEVVGLLLDCEDRLKG